MPITKVRCIKTKKEKGYNTQKEIVQFEEGKEYPIVITETTTVRFIISETGYKEMFGDNFYTYFEEVL